MFSGVAVKSLLKIAVVRVGVIVSARVGGVAESSAGDSVEVRVCVGMMGVFVNAAMTVDVRVAGRAVIEGGRDVDVSVEVVVTV